MLHDPRVPARRTTTPPDQEMPSGSAGPGRRIEIAAASDGLPPLLRTRDLALALGFGEHAVTAWIRKGMLRASKPGRFYIVLREDLLDFLARYRVAPSSASIASDIGRFVAALPPRRRRIARTKAP